MGKIENFDRKKIGFIKQYFFIILRSHKRIIRYQPIMPRDIRLTTTQSLNVRNSRGANEARNEHLLTANIQLKIAFIKGNRDEA